MYFFRRENSTVNGVNIEKLKNRTVNLMVWSERNEYEDGGGGGRFKPAATTRTHARTIFIIIPE